MEELKKPMKNSVSSEFCDWLVEVGRVFLLLFLFFFSFLRLLYFIFRFYSMLNSVRLRFSRAMTAIRNCDFRYGLLHFKTFFGEIHFPSFLPGKYSVFFLSFHHLFSFCLIFFHFIFSNLLLSDR